MVQTFDFMSKNYKHVLIQKVTFSTKKELLTQPYTRKPCINVQPMCTPIKQRCIYTPIFLSTQRLFCPLQLNQPISISGLDPLFGWNQQKPAKLHESWRLELMEYRWKHT